jgi:nitrous-oxide reductase
MERKRLHTLITAAAGLFVIAVIATSCQQANQGMLGGDDAASKVYVPPGSYDQYYAFMSGGFSGNVTVMGLPSGRLLKTIPVFSQFAENGWGYSEETKDMLNTSWGNVPWDDSHHPQLSQTAGVTDGRWLFINANNTPRLARIDLTTFETEEILEIPNSAGNHASPFITENTEYLVAATRFSVPVPQRDMSIKSYKEEFKGTISFVTADKVGEMAIAFQIMLPGYDYDISHAGMGPSHGWAFFSTYNTEQTSTLKEVFASQNDKDFIAAINWKRAEECIASGAGRPFGGEYVHNFVGEDRIARTTTKSGTTMLYPEDCSGLVYFLPTPKSPHGVDVDPTGEYIVGGGKLSTVIPVHSFTKMLAAIKNESFEGEVDGIPVLSYDAVIAGEVENAGLGPLHTEFDGRGNAYTTAFLSSEIVKWRLGTWDVVDRIPVYYSVGHAMIPGGDTREPSGDYLVAMNKLTKDRYLPTGPELAHAGQLIDISGDKMKLLLDFPLMGEPHYAQGIAAEKLMNKQVQIFRIEDNKNPFAVKSEAETRVERDGNDVHVYMSSIRSHFAPDNIEGVRLGDTVYFHITNLEQDWDVPHGFAMIGARTSELLIMPGDTRTLVWRPQREGVYPFYCTDFCSALHQEMQGYIRVSPKGSNTPITFHTGG